MNVSPTPPTEFFFFSWLAICRNSVSMKIMGYDTYPSNPLHRFLTHISHATIKPLSQHVSQTLNEFFCFYKSLQLAGGGGICL